MSYWGTLFMSGGGEVGGALWDRKWVEGGGSGPNYVVQSFLKQDIGCRGAADRSSAIGEGEWGYAV